jgi:hypothetical protein
MGSRASRCPELLATDVLGLIKFTEYYALAPATTLPAADDAASRRQWRSETAALLPHRRLKSPVSSASTKAWRRKSAHCPLTPNELAFPSPESLPKNLAPVLAPIVRH